MEVSIQAGRSGKEREWMARFKKYYLRSSRHGAVETNLTSIHEDAGLILALLSGLRIWHGSELWCRLQMHLGSGVAVAVA